MTEKVAYNNSSKQYRKFCYGKIASHIEIMFLMNVKYIFLADENKLPIILQLYNTTLCILQHVIF